MPKQPKIRPHYKADALYLLRLAQAIVADDKRPAPWRAEIADLVQQLAYRLQEDPDGQKTEETQKVETQEAQEAIPTEGHTAGIREASKNQEG